MTTNDTRLRAIETHCKALRWSFWVNGGKEAFSICTDSVSICIRVDNKGFEFAERLLSCYEPGAVVEIQHCDTTPPLCSTFCDLMHYVHPCSKEWDISGEPGPDCLGPGHYKLVKVVE